MRHFEGGYRRMSLERAAQVRPVDSGEWLVVSGWVGNTVQSNPVKPSQTREVGLTRVGSKI
jgi:hypothetical protein